VSGAPRPGASRAIAWRAFKQVWIAATVWALVFGVSIASSALTYVTSFPTPATRRQLAATTGGDAGLAVLLGPIGSVDTVGGYTFYKVYVFLTTIGAIWGLLAATRLLRGDEESGRWQLVLAGATDAGRATAATMAAIWAGLVVIFVGTTGLTLLAGRDPDVGFDLTSSLLCGLSLAIVPAVFIAVGAVTSQLGRTRRVATGLGMAVFAATFLLRMVGDSGPATRWLLWTTPFGWAELVKPFTENDPWPLLPSVLAFVALSLGAVRLAARRDVGDGLLASRDVSHPRPFGLRSAFGLATRLELPTLAGWIIGAAASAFVLGIIAKLTLASVPDSLADTLDRFGIEGDFASQYLSIAFLFVITVVALIPASQVSAAAQEEGSGRLVHVLTRPTTRWAWFGGRLVLAAAAVVAAALVAGLAAWAGATSQGVDVAFGTMVGAAANGIPIALVSLGIGAVALSIAPRVASGAVYGIVIWSLLIEMFGSLYQSLERAQWLSLFHYMALMPAEDPDPATLAITAAVGVALCLVALAVFDRRDLRSA
jgi:ABC-2 type transport system permease protein